MKPIKSLLRTAAFVLGAAPLLAQAALIDITVTGTVYNSYDETGNIFGQGNGIDIVNGQTAVLKFTYDTAAAPGDYNSGVFPYDAYYYDGTDWIESSASVGGNAVSNVVASGKSSDYSVLFLTDYRPNGGNDRITASDNDEDDYYSYDSNGNSFHHNGYSANYFYFEDYAEDFLNGVGLNQTFSATVDGNNNYGYANINQYLYDFQCLDSSCSTYQYTSYENGYAEIALNTITMSRRSADIPEPGSLALLGLGLSGLAFVRRRKALS